VGTGGREHGDGGGDGGGGVDARGGKRGEGSDAKGADLVWEGMVCRMGALVDGGRGKGALEWVWDRQGRGYEWWVSVLGNAGETWGGEGREKVERGHGWGDGREALQCNRDAVLLLLVVKGWVRRTWVAWVGR